MNKAPDAFRTISEVAGDLDLPQHVLRFWESRFPQIRPMKRGGGRRYYRPEDVELLRGIRHLLYSVGYTINGVQKILREQGVRKVQAVGQGLEVALPAPEHAAATDIAAAGRDLIDLLPSMLSGPPLSTDAASHHADAADATPSAVMTRTSERPAAASRPKPRIAAEGLDRLQAVLQQLEDCKRLLEDARDDAP